MLKLLIVKNIALSSSVELELAPGFNVMSGETGTGKSLLVDALSLLLGGRGGPDLIRTGEKAATVEGVFEAHDLVPLLEERGLPVDGDEIIIRRELQVSGRTRASLNGALVPLAALKELSPRLAVIHGQHEHRELRDPESHGALLDRFAGSESAAREVADAFALLRAIEREIDEFRNGENGLVQRHEMLAYQLAEIERAGLRPGEDERLAGERVIAANAERLTALSSEAYAALFEDDGSALERLATVYRKVRELAGLDARFRPHLAARDAVVSDLEDLAFHLRDYREKLDSDPGRLETIESRLAVIDRLKKKHGGSLASALSFAEACREELAAARSPEETIKRLEERRLTARTRYHELASDLSAGRRRAAASLEKRLRHELDELAMEKTRFRVDFAGDPGDESAWSARGLEQIEFLISPNLGEELRPLADIASGGELSRILLALRTVESAKQPRATAVFDEVDAGIGGRVAEVVGRKLKDVARCGQVLCVTHLAAIASQADVHFAVRKRVVKGRTISTVEPLDESGRVEEIARMMGGATITTLTRKHAREMLELAARPANRS